MIIVHDAEVSNEGRAVDGYEGRTWMRVCAICRYPRTRPQAIAALVYVFTETFFAPSALLLAVPPVSCLSHSIVSCDSLPGGQQTYWTSGGLCFHISGMSLTHLFSSRVYTSLC